MKRKLFVIAFALVAVIGTAVAALLPVSTDIYVYDGTNTSGTLHFISNVNLTPGSAPVTVRVTDTSAGGVVTRNAVDADGNQIFAQSAVQINATGTTIP